MYALHELGRFCCVALTAGCGNIHFGDRRLRIRCRFNVVAVMAICANGRTQVAAGNSFRVDAFTIRQKQAVADTAAFHNRPVSMTATASLGDICSIDCRTGIGSGKNCSQIAISSMAIETRGSLGTVSECLSVKTVIVISVGSRVKQGTGQVWQALSWAMTTLAL